jgi:hypothetical protein
VLAQFVAKSRRREFFSSDRQRPTYLIEDAIEFFQRYHSLAR